MFKKIQNYLLLNFPLLWNTRFVPMAIIMVVLNLAFFGLGLLSGKLNFTDTDQYFGSDLDEGVVISFGIFISIIIFIVWLVYYFKNNGFKNYYPKTALCLFKEWSIIFIICFMIIAFTMSFFYGHDVRQRNYFSEKEAKRRCDILSMASFFYEGSFEQSEYAQAVDSSGRSIDLKIDKIDFKNKKYSLYSLLNKNIESFGFNDFYNDSILKNRVKKWLVNNQKDSVKYVLSEFIKIANEHHLKASINPNQWFDLVYNYPKFEDYKTIAKDEKQYYDSYNSINSKIPIDSSHQYVKTIDNQQYLFNKYYVPANQLNYSYNKIARSFSNPTIAIEFLLVLLYVALGFSLAIFSFRVTSGKQWLISLLITAVSCILFGILSALFASEYQFLILLSLLIIIAIIHFFITTANNKSKSFSALSLNITIWSLPAILPIIYFYLIEYYRKKYDYNYIESNAPAYHNSFYDFLRDNDALLVIINLFFVLILLLFLSIKIKKWKGISED